MNENVRKEFSLDYYQTLMETYGMKTAQAYRDLFVLQRKMNKLQKKYWIEDNAVFDVKVYKEWIEKRWIIYASEYKDYFVTKNQLVKNMWILRFQTNEPIDTNVEEFDEEHWTDEPDEMPNAEKKENKLEKARAEYEKKFWKPVAKWYKNNLEWIEKKLAE